MSKIKYLLDTNVCIFYMKGMYDLLGIFKEKGPENCCISEITVAELLYGASCSNRKEQMLEEVNRFVSQFHVIPIYSSLQTYADIKASLRSQGMLIDDFDLLIGATALYNDMTIVTENIKHMSHISKLKIENWVNR